MLAGALVYLLSPDLLIEYRAVISRPKVRNLHHLNDAEIDRLLVELTANAMWREPKLGNRAPDPGDDHLWALLETHEGSILIGGDQLLLKNPPVNRTVITPRTCVDQFLHQKKPSRH